METHEISMTNSQLEKISKRFVLALNDAQFVDGHRLDEVLTAALYVVGAALKARGVVLALEAPLEISLGPLVSGYAAEAKRLRNQK